jgi:hypothetical protein
MPPFARLEQIDPRAGWPHEAHDFTPWLAQSENLALLGETLGIQIELVEIERTVGSFSADLVCRDTSTDSLVVIENQLERTDHSHLGQILTYAAGVQAVTLVWIARRFTDEHQAAVNWLNEHTDESIRFFGLEIELWRIGESPMAPKFNVVARPNDWVKSGTATRGAAISGIRQAQQQYWAAFGEWLRTHHHDPGTMGPPPTTHWLHLKSYGLSDVRNVATVNSRTSEIGVEIYLGGEQAKDRYAILERNRLAIEQAFGGSLDWQPLPERAACRVRCVLPATVWQDEADRERQYAWIYDCYRRLSDAMRPYVEQMRG